MQCHVGPLLFPANLVYIPLDYSDRFSFSVCVHCNCSVMSIKYRAYCSHCILLHLFRVHFVWILIDCRLMPIIVHYSNPGNVFRVFQSHVKKLYPYHPQYRKSINIILQHKICTWFWLSIGFQRAIATIDATRDIRNQFLWLGSKRARDFYCNWITFFYWNMWLKHWPYFLMRPKKHSLKNNQTSSKTNGCLI